jgi:hypothetical protein
MFLPVFLIAFSYCSTQASLPLQSKVKYENDEVLKIEIWYSDMPKKFKLQTVNEISFYLRNTFIKSYYFYDERVTIEQKENHANIYFKNVIEIPDMIIFRHNGPTMTVFLLDDFTNSDIKIISIR